MDTRHVLSGSSFNKLPLKLRNDRRSTRTDGQHARRNNLSFFRCSFFYIFRNEIYEREGESGGGGERERKKNSDRNKGGYT